MALALVDTLRTTRATDIVTALGANAKMKFYNGTQPAKGGTATTLLGTLIGGAVIGTVTNGVIDFTEANFTQTNASHVTGTATWVRFTTSADVFVADLNIGAGGLTFTGTVTTGVDITLGTSTITEGNA